MMNLGMSHDTPVQQFEWPIDGWFRGFRVDLVDAKGHPVPRHVMHHLIMVNFSRRQLIYSAAERLMGAGTETDGEITVPKTIGVPMSPGMKLGMYVAWHNDTGKDLDGVYLKLTMLWTPKNQNPQPVNSMPIYMDVNLTVGGSNTFDVPPGKSSKSFEFTLPVGGRLLGVGGHMHDYGVSVRLEDAETGRVVTRVVATRDAKGKVIKISRKLYGVSGDGLKLKAHHKYRVVGGVRQSDQRDQDQGRDGPHGRPVRARRHEPVAQDRPQRSRLSARSGLIAGRRRDRPGNGPWWPWRAHRWRPDGSRPDAARRARVASLAPLAPYTKGLPRKRQALRRFPPRQCSATARSVGRRPTWCTTSDRTDRRR